MTSPINSKVNDIYMFLNVFDLDLHRFAHFSKIFNFLEVNRYNYLKILSIDS